MGGDTTNQDTPSGWKTVAALTGISVVVALVALVLVARQQGAPTATPPSPPAPTQLPSSTPLVKLSPPRPQPRVGAAMAYDGGRGDIVVFGGTLFDADVGPGPPLDDTWTLRGRTWTMQSPPSSPPPMRGRPLMAYDAQAAMCVLVGEDATRPGQLVAAGWSGRTWASLPSPLPAGDEAPEGLAYDMTSGDLVLLTATASGATRTRTWDGASWTLRHPSASPPASPPPRLTGVQPAGAVPGGALALTADSVGSRTWLWQHGDWAEVEHGSPIRYDPTTATIAQDPATGQVVLAGSDPGGPTWLFTGRSWTPSGTQPVLPSREGGATLVADVATGHVVVVGEGRLPNGFDVVWTFTGGRWVDGGPV